MLAIGLMSGTSMDAIDAALVRFEDESFSVIAYEQYPIEDPVREAVRALTVDSAIAEVDRLDALLGDRFAEACRRILDRGDVPATDIAAVGSHGQTVLHLPEGQTPHTLQIGDPNLIAFKTGITTVADFRRMDMAAGGQGAPLAPAFHDHFLRAANKNRGILNLGGIANITVLPPRERAAAVIGFDTGPGNGLLDDWNRRHNQTAMDKDGHWAASGRSDQALLQALLNDPYFTQPPPKSTGRDYFNLDWLDNHLNAHGSEPAAEDVQATLLDLTAQSIADAVAAYSLDTEEMYICGGGVHNPRLVEHLRRLLPSVRIGSTREIGIDPDAVEAVTFAWLAKRRLEGKSGNLPSVTGARKPVLLGAIYSASDKSQVTSYK